MNLPPPASYPGQLRMYVCWVIRAGQEMETIPPLFITSPREMFPDPGGSKLEQLCMKGTLHKSSLTPERERSNHRCAVITKEVPLFFPP